MLREARHMGVALGLDTLRFYSIDIDVRNLADYTIFKSQGVHGLPKDLKWLYKYFAASLVRNMKPNQFIIITKRGRIGYGIFPEIPWHKQEKENIIKACGLTIEYEAPSKVQEGIDKGIYTTVGDEEHAKIISMFSDGVGGDKIAGMIQRSSRTTKVHRDKHNKAVVRVGYCSRCRRVKGKFEAERV